eukprot:366347-Chlamydomonas_euryale.AAC.5
MKPQPCLALMLMQSCCHVWLCVCGSNRRHEATSMLGLKCWDRAAAMVGRAGEWGGRVVRLAFRAAPGSMEQ